MPTCLLVEDNDGCRNLATIALGTAGFTVTTAQWGAEALALLAARSFDCAILDIVLPEVSGIELMQAIRASSAHDGMPVIGWTAAVEMVAPALAAGMVEVVVKPSRMGDLVGSVVKYIKKSQEATVNGSHPDRVC